MCTEASYPYTATVGTCNLSGCQVSILQGGVVDYTDVSTDSEQTMMSTVAQQPVSIAIVTLLVCSPLYAVRVPTMVFWPSEAKCPPRTCWSTRARKVTPWLAWSVEAALLRGVARAVATCRMLCQVLRFASSCLGAVCAAAKSCKRGRPWVQSALAEGGCWRFDTPHPPHSASGCKLLRHVHLHRPWSLAQDLSVTKCTHSFNLPRTFSNGFSQNCHKYVLKFVLKC